MESALENPADKYCKENDKQYNLEPTAKRGCGLGVSSFAFEIKV